MSYGKFLDSALQRKSDFAGITGYRLTQTDNVTGKTFDIIETDPCKTKTIATERISNSFFKPRIIEPALDHDSWLNLPNWVQETYTCPDFALSNPIFENVTKPIGIAAD
jgi:hypothetical protein